MKPVRSILEALGLVRREAERDERYHETDEVIDEAAKAANEARRVRLLDESESYRRRPAAPR